MEEEGVLTLCGDEKSTFILQRARAEERAEGVTRAATETKTEGKTVCQRVATRTRQWLPAQAKTRPDQREAGGLPSPFTHSSALESDSVSANELTPLLSA